MRKDRARLHVPVALAVVVVGGALALTMNACDDSVACGTECSAGKDDAGACLPDDAGTKSVDGGATVEDPDCESHGGGVAAG